ncbi:MAG: MoaD/ThiS family protein [Geminicoccaceae bacterium]
MTTITLKLYASLGRYLPAGAQRNMIKIDIDDGTSIQTVLDRYNLPPALCHLVLVNGVFQPPEIRADVALDEGDVLAVWPPIAGG